MWVTRIDQSSMKENRPFWHLNNGKHTSELPYLVLFPRVPKRNVINFTDLWGLKTDRKGLWLSYRRFNYMNINNFYFAMMSFSYVTQWNTTQGEKGNKTFRQSRKGYSVLYKSKDIMYSLLSPDRFKSITRNSHKFIRSSVENNFIKDNPHKMPNRFSVITPK